MAVITTKSGDPFLIDDSMVANVALHRWYTALWRGRKYAVTRMLIDGKRKTVSLHRELLEAKAGEWVDHINGDSQDNRLANLRICTNSANGHNRTRLNSNNKSGAIGVYWDAKNRRWMARIQVGRRKINLGCYLHKDDAIKARRSAAMRIVGAFTSPLDNPNITEGE